METRFLYYPIAPVSQEQERLFWSLVDKRSKNECWLWTGKRPVQDYGAFNLHNRRYRAHRVAYFLHYGIDPHEKLVCHACDTPACCNPSHLYIGLPKDNMRDKMRRGRFQNGYSTGKTQNMPKGERHGMAILTEKQVLEIRAKYVPYKYPRKQLAEEYGVTRHAIENIVNHRNWKHI